MIPEIGKRSVRASELAATTESSRSECGSATIDSDPQRAESVSTGGLDSWTEMPSGDHSPNTIARMERTERTADPSWRAVEPTPGSTCPGARRIERSTRSARHLSSVVAPLALLATLSCRDAPRPVENASPAQRALNEFTQSMDTIVRESLRQSGHVTHDYDIRPAGPWSSYAADKQFHDRLSGDKDLLDALTHNRAVVYYARPIPPHIEGVTVGIRDGEVFVIIDLGPPIQPYVMSWNGSPERISLP